MTRRLFVLAACLGITNLACAAALVLGDAAAPVAGVALGSVIRTTNAEELRIYVLRKLTDRYATQKGITVSRAESDSYLRRATAFRREDSAKQAARLTVVERELQSASLPPDRRSVLESEAQTLRCLRESAERDAATRANPSPEEMAMIDSTPAAFIKQWKINRVLYQDYAGRVIGQQGGSEPLDAYREFLEEAQARGNFVIVNTGLEAGFWAYFAMMRATPSCRRARNLRAPSTRRPGQRAQ